MNKNGGEPLWYETSKRVKEQSTYVVLIKTHIFWNICNLCKSNNSLGLKGNVQHI